MRHGTSHILACGWTAFLGFGSLAVFAAQTAVANEPTAGSKDLPNSKWAIIVGGGVAFGPKYEGAKDLEVSPVPYGDVVYDGRFFAGAKGLGANVWSSDDFNLAVSANFAAGRQRKDGIRLRALDEIDPGASLEVSASYTVFQFLSFSGSLQRDFGAGDGLQAQLGVGAAVPINDKLSFNVGVSTTWADEQHMKTYFGINSDAARRSGLRAFEADAGFKRVDMTIGASYSITERWTLLGQVGAGLLVGDAADSPIVEKDVQPSALLGLGYRF